MPRKGHRMGGKFGGSHTTLIDPAAVVADIAEAQKEVTNIAPGFITRGLPAAHGNEKVKISDTQGGILLTVRGNSSVQEVLVFSKDPQATKLAIARGARAEGLRISFGK